MARSKAQYENEIRTIVVGKVGSSLRREKILSSIINKAKDDNFIAFGKFINPESSGSISPKKDDEWFLDPDSIYVSVDMRDGYPSNAIIKLSVKLGLDEKYYYFSKRAQSQSSWWPSGWGNERGPGVINWIRQKIRNGSTNFYRLGKDGQKRFITSPNDPAIYSVSFVIARHIASQGLKKRDFTDPFNRVDKIIDKALASAGERIGELYEGAALEKITDIYLDFI
tara:strand:- start:5397 stop:6071 length:675 start_codon:yes stop_codon:yes gene_type:complete